MFARKTLAELNAEKPLQDVYFDYDKADLRDEARAALQKNAEWLKRWAGTRILIEGHCDSRGTAEYNLALGDKRAAAARDYLVSLGIPADRIQTVSKGKESPFCTEETESCWSQNRRGHFIVVRRSSRAARASRNQDRAALPRERLAPPRAGSGAAMIGRPTTM